MKTMPWQKRPAGSQDVVWRYSGNPILDRDALPGTNSVFNSAVMAWNDAFIGVFRVDTTSLDKYLHLGRSADGVTWELDAEPIRFANTGSVATGYDPRLVTIDGMHYITWCNQLHGPTIGIARTQDFRIFEQLDNAFLPFNRNGVLFPARINGSFAMLSRPSDNGHTPFGDVFYSESPDMEYWGKHRHVFGSVPDGWAWTKVGAGPVPILTDRGWLLIYHGVQTTCNGFIYSAGVALLDADEPWKLAKRSRNYILAPRTEYECVGDVPNVVFPCAALHDVETGRIAIYYGAADTVVALAFTTVDLLTDFINRHPA